MRTKFVVSKRKIVINRDEWRGKTEREAPINDAYNSSPSVSSKSASQIVVVVDCCCCCCRDANQRSTARYAMGTHFDAACLRYTPTISARLPNRASLPCVRTNGPRLLVLYESGLHARRINRYGTPYQNDVRHAWTVTDQNLWDGTSATTSIRCSAYAGTGT